MVFSRQIKAARTMLGWSAIELADHSGIGSASIKRYAVQDGVPVAKELNGNSKCTGKSRYRIHRRSFG